jgi:hypothetical protein
LVEKWQDDSGNPALNNAYFANRGRRLVKKWQDDSGNPALKKLILQTEAENWSRNGKTILATLL